MVWWSGGVVVWCGVVVVMFENTEQWAQLFCSIATIYHLHSTVGHSRMSGDRNYLNIFLPFINV